MWIVFSGAGLILLVTGLIFILIYKNKHRFVDSKGNEIKDQKIIDQKKREVDTYPLVQ